MCITIDKPETEFNPSPIRITKQHAIVSIQLIILFSYTYTKTFLYMAYRCYTLPQRSSTFTVCASQNVSPSKFKLAIMTYRFIHGMRYLTSYGSSAWSSIQSAGGRFRFLVPPSGTICLFTSHLRRHSSRLSDTDSRPFCFPVPTKTLSLLLICYYYHSSLLSGHLWSLR